MIRVVKLFSCNKNYINQGLSALAVGLYICIKSYNHLQLPDQFSPDFTWDILSKVVDNLFKWLCTIEQDGHHTCIW